MSDGNALWGNWGDGEHAVGVVEQPAGAADVPAADTSAADASQPDADQAPAADAEQQNDVPSEVDQAHIKECTQDLQSTWGDAFEPTMQSVKSIVAQAPPLIRDFILGGRLEDGTAVGNSPLVIKWLASLAPSGGKVNPSEGDSNSLDAEIAKIEAKIGTREYIRNETMQARLRHLYAQRGR